uniref:Nudix hydrolase domain-containing protein n=1 Tax=Terrapene triunguis TaxID=2587831 RepID=A0A674JX39_9SAUR
GPWGRYPTCRTLPSLPAVPQAAGGIAVGLGVTETLVKECQEEACIPPALAAQARPVGTISYTYEDHRGIFPECQFVFDLELPEEFEPHVGDGEMQEFYLLGLDEVKDAIASGDFKPNCALVALDFLIRHGHLQPDHGEGTAPGSASRGCGSEVRGSGRAG